MKTLAMRKMEKNFIAVIDKGYPRKPYEAAKIKFLAQRLKEEVCELLSALDYPDQVEDAMNECADVSNVIDYLFEKLCMVTAGE